MEKIWVLPENLYDPAETLPPLDNAQIAFADGLYDFFQKNQDNELLLFVSSEENQKKIHEQAQGKTIICRSFDEPISNSLLMCSLESIMEEIRLEQELRIAEDNAWKSSAFLENTSVDTIGEAILRIFGCRTLPALEQTLTEYCKVIDSFELLTVKLAPTYLAQSELATYQLAIPIQFQSELLAHIYVQLSSTKTKDQEHDCNEIAGLLLSLSDTVALAIERNRAIHRLNEGHQIWEASFEAIEDPVTILREDFTIVRANSSYLRLMNKSESEIYDKQLTILGQEKLASYTKFPSSEWEIQLEQKFYRIFMDRIDSPLSQGRIILRFHDASSEVEMRAEILAKEQLADLGILIGSVAHEINNPIGGIIGFSQLLLKALPPKQSAFKDVTDIHREAQRCKRIVQTMLSLVRDGDDAPEVIDLHRCFSNALALVAPEAQLLKVSLGEVKNAGENKVELLAVRSRLLHIFFHLLQESVHSVRTNEASDKTRGRLEFLIESSDNIKVTIKASPCIPAREQDSVAFNVVKMLVDAERGKLIQEESTDNLRYTITFPKEQL